MASTEAIKVKESQVSELSAKLKDAKLILLTDYRGITVDGVNTLRKNLRETNSEYLVIKNNITKRALNTNNENGLDEVLEGPTAVVIGQEDFLSPLKAIYNFSKGKDFYKIKGGIVEGKVLSVEELITLAMLPSREELLSKLAGALLGTISKLAVGLEEVRKQKEANGEKAETVDVKVEVKAEEVKEEAKTEAVTEEVKAEQVKEEPAEVKAESEAKTEEEA